jgi:hypothetical protein
VASWQRRFNLFLVFLSRPQRELTAGTRALGGDRGSRRDKRAREQHGLIVIARVEDSLSKSWPDHLPSGV